MDAYRLLVIISSVMALASAAQAYPIHSGGPIDRCPQGSLLGDGCPQNPGGTFKAVASSNQWSAYARTSGQTWAGGTHPWTFNAPGIDYAIANYTPNNQLLDATNNANLPTGCTFYPAGFKDDPMGVPQVYCANVNNLSLKHLDFTKGGTECIQLWIDTSVGGPLDIEDNRFQGGPPCVRIDATVVGHMATAVNSPTSLVIDSFVSGSIVSGDYIEGGYIQSDFTITGSGTATGSYAISGGKCADGNACPTNDQIYYIGDTNSFPVNIVWNNPNITTITIKNNYFDGKGDQYPTSLADFVRVGTSASTSLDMEYNAFLRIPGRVVTYSTQVATKQIINHNYLEDWCYDTADGHCEINTHTVQSGVTDPLHQFSYNVTLLGKTPFVVPGGTAHFWLGNSNDTTAHTTLTQVDHNIMVDNCVPNGPNVNGSPEGMNTNTTASSTCTAVAEVNSSSGVVELQDGTYDSLAFTGNFIDSSGTIYTSYTARSDTVCTTPASWNGNYDLVANTPITTWTSNGATPGGC